MSLRFALVLLVCCLSISQASAQEFFPYVMPWNDNAANFTNLSGWNDKPAGRDGFVTVRDGHLYAGEKRLRMIGVNIVFGSCFPSHDDANGVAARLARIGVNVVRFHHMDSSPAPRGILQRDMRTLDAGQLEKLDYFIAALKREGVYSDINLHVGRKYPGFADWGEQAPKYWKGVDNFFEPMIVMQKDYTRDLLTHVNAYTGKRYIDEPAVALIEINNENGLLHEWRVGSLNEITEPYGGAMQQRWVQWLKKRYGDNAGLGKAWGAREVPPGAEMFGSRVNVNGAQPGWNLQVVGKAQATATSLEDGIGIVKVTQAGEERWHVQWHQNGLRFKGNEPYIVNFRLRADRPLRLRLQAMQAHAPWSALWSTDLQVDTQWRDYSFTFMPTADEDNARFTLGELGASVGTLSMASASLRPGGSLGLNAGESLERGNIAIETSSSFLSRTLQGQQDWLQFLWDTEVDYWTGMQRYLRSELGAKSLIVGTQVSYSPATIQGLLDVVDGHAYWQHPNFPGKPWDLDNWRIGNSPMAGLDGAGTLADLALRRMPGKPFIVTEYNHPAPGEYAAEGFPLVAAYAALQDWDGFFLYSYGAHDGDWNPGRMINFFDTQAAPNRMSSLIAAAAMFRRGDVATPVEVNDPPPALAMQIESLRRTYKMPAADLWGAPRNAAVLKPVSIGTPAGNAISLPVRSQTGQLVWGVDKGRTVSIDTPRSKGLIGARLRDAFDASGVSLQLLQANNDNGVLLATLIEGESFVGKGRVLITALGSEENTGQRWLDASHSTIGRQWGSAPVRVEGIAARITLPVPTARVSVWALDERGNRRSALPVVGDKNAVIEIGPQYRALWYELEVR